MKLKQIVSFLSVVAMVFTLVPSAYAASFTNLKDTLSSSAPSAGAKHEFRLNAPTGLTAGSNREIDITFPAQFNVASIVAADIATFNIASTPYTVVDGAPGAGQIGYTLSGSTMKFALASDVSISAGGLVEITIGDGASAGLNDITNPSSTGSYQIELSTYSDVTSSTVADEGTLSVNINNTVTVTATVQSSMTFTITGITTSGSCNYQGGTVAPDVNSTASSIPYGNLDTAGNSGFGVAKTACQTLSVSTNASDGYEVTVQQNQDLTSAGGDSIAKFIGTHATGAAWANHAGHLGYFGYTTEDVYYTGFSSEKYAGLNNSGDPQPHGVAYASGPVSGDTTTVSYRIQAGNLQPAGVYTNTLMYICTATF